MFPSLLSGSTALERSGPSIWDGSIIRPENVWHFCLQPVIFRYLEATEDETTEMKIWFGGLISEIMIFFLFCYFFLFECHTLLQY